VKTVEDRYMNKIKRSESMSDERHKDVCGQIPQDIVAVGSTRDIPSATRIPELARGSGTADCDRTARSSDSNGEKNNDLHWDWCSVGWRSGRNRKRLNPTSTSNRYLPYGLMCSKRAGESRAMSSSFTVRPPARSCSITAAM
jgi:hypothetical protein